MRGWACYVLIFHQKKRTFGGWRTSSRDFASSLLGNCKTLSTQKHTQHVLRWLRCSDSRSCRRCDSCTEPESGGWFWRWRAGLVVFWIVISRNGLLVTGERAVETWPIFVFRLTFYVHRGSGQARVYPRRRLSLSSRAKAFTLQGRHRRFVGDSAVHTSLRGAPLLVGEQQSGITRFYKKYRIWSHMTAYHRVLYILLYSNMHYLLITTVHLLLFSSNFWYKYSRSLSCHNQRFEKSLLRKSTRCLI